MLRICLTSLRMLRICCLQSNLAAHAPTSLRLLQPRCSCSDLAAPAPTSLRLLQPRCACADLAAHLTDLAAHALMPRMLRASLRMLQNLAAHALTPNLAAHAPRVTTVYTRRKKLIFVNNMFIFRFLFMRIKSSCFFLGGLP